MQPQALPWCEPLSLANSLGDGPMVLLYSSARAHRSILAHGLLEAVDVSRFSEVDALLTTDQSAFAHAWFGYLGYEMRHDAERYAPSPPGRFALPRGRLMRFSHVYVFDHAKKTLTLWSEEKASLPALREMDEAPAPAVSALSSNMSRAEYEAKVVRILREIAAGTLYQANLTRKFFGQWEHAPHGLSLFARMSRATPAPFSAYLRMESAEVLSSSPESFLQLGADGRVTSRPIKGTAPRGATNAEDAANRRALELSEKDRAENLMITDLMRNDLARVCEKGSVSVSNLFEVTGYETIFHMASTVSGRLAQAKTPGALVAACFPPGSMTGAPKIRAVELCAELEGMERGIYSGAIGWFGGDGTCDLSVVIRTLIRRGREFEFQVGGGIVADSAPAREWAETMDKSMGILKSLDMERAELEKL